ncbi:MAG: hypothetical protein ACFE75_08775, partial [Candidatus Hodarchaeota archaeon]
MTGIKQEEEELLDKALAEEKTYNWLEAANLYERVAESLLKKKMLEKTAEIYRKLGYSYSRAAFTVRTAEKLAEYFKQTIKAYKDAMILFEQIGNKSMKLECEAEASYFSGYIASTIEEAREEFSNSYELFIKVSEEYSREADEEHIARILSRTAFASVAKITSINDPKKIEEIYEKGIYIAHKAQILSKKINCLQSLAESFYAEFYLINFYVYIKPFRWDESWREYSWNMLLRCKENLKFIEKYDDLKALSMIYLVFGTFNGFFAINFAEDERGQRKYLDNALGLLEKASDLAKKLNDRSLLLESVYWLDWWALLGVRFNYLQKRISVDLQLFIEMGKLFKDTYSIEYFQSYQFIAFYYMNMAQRSFFTSAQRKSYAEEAIKYAKKKMIVSSFLPSVAESNLVLTYSYSQLSILASSKDKQDEYTHKMLQYAEHAGEIAEKYEGGWVRAYGYNALFRAYKTLADITQDKENKIEMLKASIDASEKYLEHSNEARTGIITGQIRLGLLYEELGILTINNDTLVEAKELFLKVSKESLERGYNSYAAAIFEYIARIEDRLGNHTASAKYYVKAQNSYKESLKNVEYKPLIKRINEKLNYVKAWNLIEIAKFNHKSENHQEANESYNSACEILKNLPS